MFMHVLFELQLEETLGQVETSFFSCVEPNRCINYGKTDRNILIKLNKPNCITYYKLYLEQKLGCIMQLWFKRSFYYVSNE